MASFTVDVSPSINRVALGGVATFECNVAGNVDVREYKWDGQLELVRDGRFSYGQSNNILYVNDIKAYDNESYVDCTVTATDGRRQMGSGRIFVLPSLEGAMSKNGSMEGMKAGEIPYLTAGGGVVIAFGFILVIAAMFGALRWLKSREIQKQDDLEKARNRYSRIEIRDTGASSRARYDRDQGNVRLGGYEAEEAAHDDDSYEDMLPVVPKKNIPGGSAHESSRSASRSGAPRYGHVPRR